MNSGPRPACNFFIYGKFFNSKAGGDQPPPGISIRAVTGASICCLIGAVFNVRLAVPAGYDLDQPG